MSIHSLATKLSIYLPIQVMLLSAGPSLAVQCEVQKLTASDAGFGGQNLAKSLDADSPFRCLAGASFASGQVAGTGAAYLFERSGTTWFETHKLMASDGAIHDQFGSSVGVSANWIAVGATLRRVSGNEVGAVYTYNWTGSAWIETQILSPSLLLAGDGFGISCAVQGTTLVVGCYKGDGNSSDSGTAFVYEWNGVSWELVATLWDPAGQTSDSFGITVAVDGDWIIVGAHHDSSVGPDVGAVHFYQRVGQSWVRHSELSPQSPRDSQDFGYSVSLEGERALVGSRSDDVGSGVGSAYIFEYSGTTWVETAKLLPTDLGGIDQFGSSVSLSGSRAHVGSMADGLLAEGSVYVFEESANEWNQVAKFRASDGGIGDILGGSIAAAGGSIYGGAFLTDLQAGVDAGAAYVFSLPLEFAPYCMNTACPCGNTSPLTGCVNETGAGAHLTGCGTASVAADDLILTAANLQANQFGIFYMGAGAIELPFGDGARCVSAGGTGTFRYAIQSSGNGGALQLGPGVAALSQQRFPPAGQIAPGDTWNFQAWFRDPGGPCGAAFNLSSAISIEFVP